MDVDVALQEQQLPAAALASTLQLPHSLQQLMYSSSSSSSTRVLLVVLLPSETEPAAERCAADMLQLASACVLQQPAAHAAAVPGAGRPAAAGAVQRNVLAEKLSQQVGCVRCSGRWVS
jgi:hypothetical protein